MLKSAHAYPSPAFPGHTQEGLLNQLLRKKLEPGVEGWIETGLKSDQSGVGANATGLAGVQRGDSRDLAIHALQSAARTQEKFQDEGLWSSDYTIAEIDAGSDEMSRIQAGLKRRLVGRADQESEEEDEDEDLEDGEGVDDSMPSAKERDREKGIDSTKTPLPLETMLKFISTGELPPGYQGV